MSLPPPLPPETRTVGQLVAEAVRLYGRRFWPSLALGLGPALLGSTLPLLSPWGQVVALSTAGGIVAALSFVGACAIAAGVRPTGRSAATAVAAGVLAFAPFPVLASFLVLPGLAWLALVGLAVPVAVIERASFRDSFRRAFALARADYVHALGSLATLAITALLTTFVLFFLLRGQAEVTLAVAGFLAVLVISPVLFLGGALLYFDQAARVVDSGPRTPRPRRSDADVHHADDADGAGRADAEVEPGAAARGQP